MGPNPLPFNNVNGRPRRLADRLFGEPLSTRRMEVTDYQENLIRLDIFK